MPKPETPLPNSSFIDELLSTVKQVPTFLGQLPPFAPTEPTAADKELLSYLSYWNNVVTEKPKRMVNELGKIFFHTGEDAETKLNRDGSLKGEDILSKPPETVYFSDDMIGEFRKKGYDVSDLPVEPRALRAAWEAAKHPIETGVKGVLTPVVDFAGMVWKMAEPDYGPNAPLYEKVFKDLTKVYALAYGLTLKPLVDSTLTLTSSRGCGRASKTFFRFGRCWLWRPDETRRPRNCSLQRSGEPTLQQAYSSFGWRRLELIGLRESGGPTLK